MLDICALDVANTSLETRLSVLSSRFRLLCFLFNTVHSIMMQDLETTSCKPEDLHVQSSLCISDKAGVHVLA